MGAANSITLREAAELSAVNIRRIKQAVKDGELALCCYGPPSKLWRSELWRWWHHCQDKALRKAAYLKKPAARVRKAKLNAADGGSAS
jgi:hypothetical protein